MGIVFRQSVKTTIVILIGSILGGVLIILSTYMVPDKQQLGFTRNLTNQAAVLSQFLLFGLQGTLAVFIHRYAEDDRRRQSLITICMVLPFLFIGLASVIYILFKEPIVTAMFQPQDIPYIKRYFLWLPLFVLFFSYQVLLEQYLTSQMKLAVATFMREVVLRVLNIVLIVLFGYGVIPFDWLVAGMVLIYMMPSLLMFYFAQKTKGFGFTFNFQYFTKGEYKEIVHFAWYHTLLSISVSLMGFIDSLMIASIDKNGLSSVAVYSVAVFVISVMLIPFKAMVPAAFPDLAKAFKDNDMVKAKDVYMRSSINILITSVAMALLICCNLSNLVHILPDGFEAVQLLVLIMLIGRMADMATGMNDQLVTVSKYYKFNFYMSIVLVGLIVVFNLVLIPLYGFYGAAWGTSVALALYNAGKYVYVYMKLKIQPFTMNSFWVFVCGIIALLPGYFMPFILNNYVDAIARSGVIMVAYFLMLLWLKPSKDLDTYLSSIRKNKRLF
jgi:O-antigen/teichoic acid export membrane protein